MSMWLLCTLASVGIGLALVLAWTRLRHVCNRCERVRWRWRMVRRDKHPRELNVNYDPGPPPIKRWYFCPHCENLEQLDAYDVEHAAARAFASKSLILADDVSGAPTEKQRAAVIKWWKGLKL